tara:strand:- start:260 stop:781 length:522 start_codon:yes stop_codon:yes gene_type:complete
MDKRSHDELLLENEDLLKQIKRLKKETNDDITITAVSIGTQTDNDNNANNAKKTKHVDAKRVAYLDVVNTIQEWSNNGHITDFACHYAVDTLTEEYENRKNNTNFTIESIDDLRDLVMSMADTITTIEKAGVDIHTYDDAIISFVENVTNDAPKNSALWFTKQVDDFIDKYLY